MDFTILERLYTSQYSCLFSYSYYLRMVINGLKLISHNANTAKDYVDQKALAFAKEYNFELFTSNESALLNNSCIY